ncbi:RHS repeat-associated core domain-containing protein, partial [Polaromonas sp.]|uniref:RHS repeat-associated core domain-containing protein n=1 Tax=Polaromonas sp. TaxID=1869339 RepID=UPI00352B0BF4
TGLYYNRHRYYDPVVGSYINQDPIGLTGGINLMQYATSIPILRTDPKGLEWILGKTFPKDSASKDNPLNSNTVYCDDGEIKINSNNIGRCQNALGTTVAHEHSHRNDVVKKNPDICKDNKGVTQILSTDMDERLSSERKAHELELAILERALKDPPIGCTTIGIEAEISATKNGLSKVNAGTYPN